MSISYLLTIEQLSVLAYFQSIDSFHGFSSLPVISREKCDELLEYLNVNGMIHLQGDRASVDVALGFILHCMAAPQLYMKTAEGIHGYCTSGLGVVVFPDRRSSDKFRITPLPDAHEFTEQLWKNYSNEETVEFSLWTEKSILAQKHMSKPELKARILKIYTEAHHEGYSD